MRAISLSCSLLAVADANAQEAAFDPFTVPRAVFESRVATIALAPVDLPPSTPEREAVQRQIEEALTQRLQAKGYEVIPPGEFEQTWRAASRQIGGIYDPVTGKSDEKKHDAVLELTGRELGRRFSADAVARTFVRSGAVIPWAEGGFGEPARYVAVGEPLVWRGKPIDGLLANLPQLVVAAYLNLRIDDLTGAEMYGIRFPLEWTRVYVGRGYEDAKRPTALSSAPLAKAADAVTELLPPRGGAPATATAPD